MSQKAKQPRIAGLDFVFVLISAVAVVKLQSSDSSHTWALAVPVVYLILSKVLTGADLPSAAGRAYLLCFVAGMAGLVAQVSELMWSLRAQIENQSSSAIAASAISAGPVGEMYPWLLQAAADLLANLAAPLMLGIGLYAACSVFELASANSEQQVKPILDKLNEWFEASGTPEELRQYVIDMHQRMNDLQQGCAATATQFSAAEKGLSLMTNAAAQTNSTLNQVCSNSTRLSGELQELSNDIAGVRAAVDQWKAAVSQIGNVVDELSDIVSKRILEL